MPELKEVLSGVMVKALGFTDAEVSSLITDDGVSDEALTTILDRHASGIAKLKDQAKKDRDAAFARGTREKGEEWEKLVESAGVKLDGATGPDAVKKLTEHIEAVKVIPELEEDKVKAHPAYRKLEKEIETKAKEVETVWSKKWQDRDAEEQRNRTLQQVKKLGHGFLAELKPNLPEDPKKAANQLSVFERELEGYNYVIEDDDVVILDKEGKRVEGPNGHPVKLAELSKQIAEKYYDFAVVDPKGSAGDPGKGAKTGGGKLQKPANRAAYAKQLAEIQDNPALSVTEKVAMGAELKALAADLTA
jgi:hypothetical protein